MTTKTIALTCRKCGRAFKRRVRVGLHTSCTHCGEIQPGPEGQKAQDERLRRIEEGKARRREREQQRRQEQDPGKGKTDPPADPPKKGVVDDKEGGSTTVTPHKDPTGEPPGPPPERHAGLVF